MDNLRFSIYRLNQQEITM